MSALEEDQADDAGHDKQDADDAGDRGRLVKEDHPQYGRHDSTDPRPNRVGRSDRKRLHGNGKEIHAHPHDR